MTPLPFIPDDAKNLISSPTASMCGNFINTLLKLPTLFYKLVNWMFNADGSVSNNLKQFSVPTGTVLEFAGTAVPTDYLLCDGQAVSRTTYADLFGVIGTTFGIGNGTTTFNVPDRRAKFAVGVGTFAASGSVSVGGTGGEDKHVLTIAETAKHKHLEPSFHSDSTSNNINQIWEDLAGTGPNTSGLSVNATTSPHNRFHAYSEETGGDTAHNNLPPYIGMNFIIKT